MEAYYLQEVRTVKDLNILIDIFGYNINIYKLYSSDKDRPIRYQLREPFAIVSHDKKVISLFQFEDAPRSLMYHMFGAVSMLFELYPDYTISNTTTSNCHYISYLESIKTTIN